MPNLYRISQRVNTGYDTYDSAVVCADNVEHARSIHPSGWVRRNDDWSDDWAAEPSQVSVQLIGTAAPGIEAGTVLVASFNAG